MNSHRGTFLLLFASAVFLGIFVYQAIVRVTLAPVMHLPSLLSTARLLPLCLLLSSWLHAWFSLGLGHSLAFLGLTVVISWVLEQVGVATGWVYGTYHYTDLLGPKVGHVPLLIPVSWFMMSYPSYVISNVILDGRPVSRWSGARHWLCASVLGALVMTAWDVAMDPLMSGAPHGAWIWHNPGPYFGVPLHNFVGWVTTTFAIHGVYRLFERSHPSHPLGVLGPQAASLPVWAYGAMMSANVAAGGPEALRWITLIVMGVPFGLALAGLQPPRP